MSSEEQNSELYKALNSCGRRERQLSASNLDHHRDILIALFGQAALKQEHERRIKAQLVEDTMREIIESYADGAERRAAEVVFASKPEFYGMNVNQRIAVVETKDHSFTRDQYPRLRKRVIANMTTALRYALTSEDDSADDTPLSPTVEQVASQLYRFAQPTLAILEAFNDCVRFESELGERFQWASLAKVEIVRTKQGWLGQFGQPGKDFRIVPVDVSLDGIKAFWTFAYYQKCLRSLLKDKKGRDYLRRNLSIDLWVEVQKYAPFAPDEIDLMEATLDTIEIDEALDYFKALSRDEEKHSVYQKWMTLLTTDESKPISPEKPIKGKLYSNDRKILIWVMLSLCIILQNDFPKETLISPYEDYTLAIYSIIFQGLVASNAYKSGDFHEQMNHLVDDIVSRMPSRYSIRLEDEPVWSDEVPEHDPWAY